MARSYRYSPQSVVCDSTVSILSSVTLDPGLPVPVAVEYLSAVEFADWVAPWIRISRLGWQCVPGAIELGDVVGVRLQLRLLGWQRTVVYGCQHSLDVNLGLRLFRYHLF